MKPAIEIPYGNAPQFSFADFGVEYGRFKVKIRSSFKIQPALLNVPLILGGIERNFH